MSFLNRLRKRLLGQAAVPTRAVLVSIWDAFSDQWHDDIDDYDCWKPASVLPARKGMVKLAVKRAYDDWPQPIDHAVFSAFFAQYVDIATYLPQEKYEAVRIFKAGRLMRFGSVAAQSPLSGFKLSSGLASRSTPETCDQDIINIRDRMRRSEAWDPIDSSDLELDEVRQILLESAVEHAALTAEWRFYILSIGREEYDSDPSLRP